MSTLRGETEEPSIPKKAPKSKNQAFTPEKRTPPRNTDKTRNITSEEEFLLNVDHVPCNVRKRMGKATLVIFEDDEAVIKTTIEGRSPNMRHITRTHRINTDWLFERIRDDPGIKIRYVGTKQQIADFLTKGAFTAEQWKVLCNLSNIGEPGIRIDPKTNKELLGGNLELASASS